MRSRLVRLGLPLLTGMALIVPIQNAILRLGPPADIHLPATGAGMVLSHLWFLPVLLMLCAALAASWKIVSRLSWPDLPVWVLGLGCGLWELALLDGEHVTGLNLSMMDGMIDVESTLAYAPYFVLGVAARRNPAILSRFTRFDVRTMILGLAALAVYCRFWHPAARIEYFAAQFSGAIAALCVMQVLLALLARHFNRPSPLVDRLVDASFSIYLFHHPIIIALAVALLYVPLSPVVEWLLICTLTLAGSYAIHRAIMRSRLLLMLFNGVMPRSGRGLLSQAPNAPSPS